MLSDNPIGVHFVVAIKICRIEKINTIGQQHHSIIYKNIKKYRYFDIIHSCASIIIPLELFDNASHLVKYEVLHWI